MTNTKHDEEIAKLTKEVCRLVMLNDKHQGNELELISKNTKLKNENGGLKLSPKQCLMICEALDIDSELFDSDSEEYILLMDHNPELFEAYTILFTIGINND